MRMLAVVMVFMTAACVVEHTPDTPGNAAIQLMGAFQQLDREVAASLMCSAATDSEIDFEMPETLGALHALYEVQVGRSVAGGSSEYTSEEEVELEVDVAWTEVDIGTGSSAETWRLHMIRDAGSWKACSAERQ
jgi:hypothetical protein